MKFTTTDLKPSTIRPCTDEESQTLISCLMLDTELKNNLAKAKSMLENPAFTQSWSYGAFWSRASTYFDDGFTVTAWIWLTSLSGGNPGTFLLLMALVHAQKPVGKVTLSFLVEQCFPHGPPDDGALHFLWLGQKDEQGRNMLDNVDAWNGVGVNQMEI